MNYALFLMISPKSMKKITILVISTLVVILALPIGAVLAFSNLPLLVGISASSGGPDPSTQQVFDEPAVPEDRYTYGYCTYWTALRRIQIGKPIPNNWGDAITWNINALLAGYLVDHHPTVGSIYQWPAAPGGEGHVAFVEAVNPIDGSWTISEMNAVGWNVVDNRTYPASDAKKYNFIHDKEIHIDVPPISSLAPDVL